MSPPVSDGLVRTIVRRAPAVTDDFPGIAFELKTLGIELPPITGLLAEYVEPTVSGGGAVITPPTLGATTFELITGLGEG